MAIFILKVEGRLAPFKITLVWLARNLPCVGARGVANKTGRPRRRALFPAPTAGGSIVPSWPLPLARPKAAALLLSVASKLLVPDEFLRL